jgi:hypothetical protein
MVKKTSPYAAALVYGPNGRERTNSSSSSSSSDGDTPLANEEEDQGHRTEEDMEHEGNKSDEDDLQESQCYVLEEPCKRHYLSFQH